MVELQPNGVGGGVLMEADIVEVRVKWTTRSGRRREFQPCPLRAVDRGIASYNCSYVCPWACDNCPRLMEAKPCVL